jgi:diaminopimelate decarboxylase
VTQSTQSDVLRGPGFAYRRIHRGRLSLFCEQSDLAKLAERFGTPLYVYSSKTIRSRFRSFTAAFSSIRHTVCYSVKANSSLAILRLLERQGAGFDVVSGGELERVLHASSRSVKAIVFSGVGKTIPEMKLALKAGILLFNVESASELHALAATAALLKKKAPIAFRVNPDVSAKTHPYISTGLHEHKFGVPIPDARALYAEAIRHPNLVVRGVSVHIGSQITDMSSFKEALERLADLVRELRAAGHPIHFVDAGGGLGISYRGENDSFVHSVTSYAKALIGPLRKLGVHLLLEPGRSIVGPAGVLVTRVVYRKENNRKRFLIVDAAMNDLLRPSLYGAHHEMVPVAKHARNRSSDSENLEVTDVVGPICETGDFFARDRELSVMAEGDLLAILDTGAYGSALSSNYNSRGRPAEVLVEGDRSRIIRRRETIRELIRLEAR